MNSLLERYNKYKECYLNNIEEEHDKGSLSDEDYDEALVDVISYDDFVGNVIDEQFESSYDDEH